MDAWNFSGRAVPRVLFTRRGEEGKFDSLSPFNRGAKRKCGPRLHWLDKRVTTSAVYFLRNRTPVFVRRWTGREENCNNGEAVISPLPFGLQFFPSHQVQRGWMKYKMKSWEIKKKKNYPRLKTTRIPNLTGFRFVFPPTSPELRTNLILSLSLLTLLPASC